MRTAILQKGPELRLKILFWLVVIVPLAFSRSFYQTYTAPKLGLVMIGVAVAGGIRIIEIIQGASSEGLRRLWIPAAAFVVPLSIAWVFAPYRTWSLFGQLGRFQGLIPYVVIILFGILIADAFGGRAQRLAEALVLSAAIMSLYHLLQFFGLDPFPLASEGAGNRAARGTMGNTNFAGGFLAIALPVAVGQLLANDSEREKAGIALALIVAGLVVTFSQGAYAGALAGVAVSTGILFTSKWRFARWAGFALAGLVAAVAVGSILASIVKPGHPRIPLTIQDRGRYWEQAGSMFAESPLIGRGPNAFAVEATQYRPARDATQAAAFDVADDPHSVFLAMLTSAGILGGLGYLVAMGWLLRRGLQIPPDNVLAVSFFGGGVAYFVQSLASIDEVGLRVAFWIVLAGLTAATVREADERAPAAARNRKKTKEVHPLRWPIAVGVTALLGVSGAAWAARFMVADIQVRSGIELFTDIKPFEGQEAFESALGFRDDFEYRSIYGFQSGQTAVDGGEDAGLPFAEERDEAYAYLAEFPDVGAMRDQAVLLNSWSRAEPDAADEAADLYLRAVGFDPINPRLTDEASVVLMEVGRVEDAEEVLNAHLAAAYPGEPVEPRLASKWGSLAVTFAQQTEVELAEEAIERALAIDPAQPEALQAQEMLETAAAS